MKRIIFFLPLACILLLSCSAPKEEIQVVKPDIKVERTEPVTDARVFKFEDRYYVKGSSIDVPTNLDDPLQALRVIQLKESRNETLVISSFDKENGESQEIWFGMELPSFAPGTYDLAKAVNIKYYRFSLGASGMRVDGKTFVGTLKVEEVKDGSIVGYIRADITGVTKSFDAASKEVNVQFSGSFRIQEVPLEATRIGQTKK